MPDRKWLSVYAIAKMFNITKGGVHKARRDPGTKPPLVWRPRDDPYGNTYYEIEVDSARNRWGREEE
jgi:hypothetical protein